MGQNKEHKQEISVCNNFVSRHSKSADVQVSHKTPMHAQTVCTRSSPFTREGPGYKVNPWHTYMNKYDFMVDAEAEECKR